MKIDYFNKTKTSLSYRLPSFEIKINIFFKKLYAEISSLNQYFPDSPNSNSDIIINLFDLRSFAITNPLKNLCTIYNKSINFDIVKQNYIYTGFTVVSNSYSSKIKYLANIFEISNFIEY